MHTTVMEDWMFQFVQLAATEEPDFESDFEEKIFDFPLILSAEHFEYVLCAYHTALKEYQAHTQFLPPGQKNTMTRPTYRGFA